MPPLPITGTIWRMSLTSPPRFGKKANLALWAVLALVLLGVLGWLVFGHLDNDDPVVTLKTPVEAVGAKTSLTLEAGDETSGLKEVKITFSQAGQEKVILEKKFPPGARPVKRWKSPAPWNPRPWASRRARPP